MRQLLGSANKQTKKQFVRLSGQIQKLLNQIPKKKRNYKGNNSRNQAGNHFVTLGIRTSGTPFFPVAFQQHFGFNFYLQLLQCQCLLNGGAQLLPQGAEWVNSFICWSRKLMKNLCRNSHVNFTLTQKKGKENKNKSLMFF